MLKVSKILNERSHIMKMINEANFIKPGSIFIFDGGYYSKELLKFLLSKGIVPIFRLRYDLDICQKLDADKKEYDEIIVENNVMKLLKYNINNENFYILTSDTILLNDKLKNLYWFRWFIEEFYKKVKHVMKGFFYNVSSDNIFKQSIYSQQIVSMYTQIIILITKKYEINLIRKRRLNKPYVKRETDINFKCSLDIQSVSR